MLRFLNGVCLALLVSCSSQPKDDTKEAGKQTATIEGSVREFGTDVPIAVVSVFLVRPSDQLQVRTTTDADGRFRIEVDSQAVRPGQTFVLAILLTPEKRIVPLLRNEEQVKITIGNDFKPLEMGTVTVDDKGVER